MAPENLHDLFFAAAGVAGALIGLLFVAISIEHDRLTDEHGDQVHRVRARSALAAFVNALVVSLFALVPGDSLGICAMVSGILNLLFVAGSVLSVRRARRSGTNTNTGGLRNLTFLIGMMVIFAFQCIDGVRLYLHHHDPSAAETIAVLVILSALVGIYRSWELIGGPNIGFGHELRALVREQADHDGHPDGDSSASAGDEQGSSPAP